MNIHIRVEPADRVTTQWQTRGKSHGHLQRMIQVLKITQHRARCGSEQVASCFYYIYSSL